MDPEFPYPEGPPKPFGAGPPPPDIVNPLDRLAKRPRPVPFHGMPPYPMPIVPQGAVIAHDTMSQNFAPPPRAKLSSSGSPLREDVLMKESGGVMSEQGECPLQLVKRFP